MPEMLLTRRATLSPTTLDLEARTAEAVISSGATVRRFGMFPDNSGFGFWDERLDLAGVDVSAGLPVLLDHRAADSRARIGVVEAVRREPAGLVARLRFSQRPEVVELLRDLQDGIGGAVSIGYSVLEWQR